MRIDISRIAFTRIINDVSIATAVANRDGMGADRRQFLAESRDIMTISLSNSMVLANAPTGTTVGVLTANDGAGSIVPCNFILTKRAGGYFSVSGNNLITAWNGSILPAYYSLRVHANGIYTRFGNSGNFVINVVQTSPPAPPPAPQTRTHWNESDTVTGILFSDADLTCSSSMGVVHSHNGTRSNTFKSTGKWYFELHTYNVGGATTGFGIAKTSADLTKEGGDDTNSIVIDIQGTAPQVRYNAGLKGSQVGNPYSNVTYAFAVDFDAGLFWGRNLGSGTQYWNGSSSADPVTATGGITFSAGGAHWCMFTTFSNTGDSTTMNLVRQLYNRGIGENGNREIRELSEAEHRSAGSQWPWARSAAQGSGRLPRWRPMATDR